MDSSEYFIQGVKNPQHFINVYDAHYEKLTDSFLVSLKVMNARGIEYAIGMMYINYHVNLYAIVVLRRRQRVNRPLGDPIVLVPRPRPR